MQTRLIKKDWRYSKISIDKIYSCELKIDKNWISRPSNTELYNKIGIVSLIHVLNNKFMILTCKTSAELPDAYIWHRKFKMPESIFLKND